MTKSRFAIPRILAPAVLSCAIVLTAFPALAAPIGFNAFGGWYTDPSNFVLGAGARMSFAQFAVNPNAEYIFVESGSSYTLNLDGTMSLMPLGVGSLYAGGGVAWAIVDPENGDSNTDTGVNVLGGFGLNAAPLKPYGQIKWTFLPDDTPFSFTFGVRF